MNCSCDEIGESPCKEHGYGLLECVCGMRFTAPLVAKDFMLVQCPHCGQLYSGHEEHMGHGSWKREGTVSWREKYINRLVADNKDMENKLARILSLLPDLSLGLPPTFQKIKDICLGVAVEEEK